jgi:hypothetical protein
MIAESGPKIANIFLNLKANSKSLYILNNGIGRSTFMEKSEKKSR